MLDDRLRYSKRGRERRPDGRRRSASWGLVGGVGYWLPWSPLPSIQPYLGLGYRQAAFERDFGTDNSIDLQFRGPTSSMGFVF